MLVVGLPWSEYFVNHLAVNRAIIAGYQVTPDRLKNLSRSSSSLSDAQLGWRATAQPSLTESEQRAHFSLWAMLAAPLIAGNDVRSMTDATRDILTNADVIAVDQDPLVAPGRTRLPRIRACLSNHSADGSRGRRALSTPVDQPATIASRRDRGGAASMQPATRSATCGRTPTPPAPARSAASLAAPRRGDAADLTAMPVKSSPPVIVEMTGVAAHPFEF